MHACVLPECLLSLLFSSVLKDLIDVYEDLNLNSNFTSAASGNDEEKHIHLTVEILSQYFEGKNDIPVPWLEDINVVSFQNWAKIENEEETKRVEGLFISKKFGFMRMLTDFLNSQEDVENNPDEIVFEVKPNARLNSKPNITMTRS